MVEAAICPAIVAQDILKHVVQLAEIVISGSGFDDRQERFALLWRECCRCTSKCHGSAQDIPRVIVIQLLRRAITGRFFVD